MGTARSSPDLADGMDCVDCAAYFTPWTNWRQSGPTFSEQPPLFPRSSEPLLLACCFFPISFSSVLSPCRTLTQFSPHYLCPSSNVSYYEAYTSLSSHLSRVLILTPFIVSPVSSWSSSPVLFPTFPVLPDSFSQDSYRWAPGEDLANRELTNRQYRNYDRLCISRSALH